MQTATIAQQPLWIDAARSWLPRVAPARKLCPCRLPFDGRLLVVRGSLAEDEWDLVRAFVHRMEPDDLRARFGHPIAFDDERTLRRFFDVDPATGEIAFVLDETGAIAGLSHRIMVSAAQAEFALIVRSDRKRRGIGECLLRSMMVRAARQGFETLTALVLRDNRAVLKLVAKVGFTQRAATTYSIELGFALG
jgi:acetyltransferase